MVDYSGTPVTIEGGEPVTLTNIVAHPAGPTLGLAPVSQSTVSARPHHGWLVAAVRRHLGGDDGRMRRNDPTSVTLFTASYITLWFVFGERSPTCSVLALNPPRRDRSGWR